MLKVASVRLRNLKLQERRYKGALVKRACMHLLVKSGGKYDRFKDRRTYEELVDEGRADDVNKRVDWNSGFWGTALGKFLRPYFETKEHKDAYIQWCSQFRTKAEMKQWCLANGVPGDWIDDIANQAQVLKTGRHLYLGEAGDAARAKERSDVEAADAEIRKQIDKQNERRRALGLPPLEYPTKRESGSRGSASVFRPNIYDEYAMAYRRGSSPLDSSFLTDMMPVYDSEYLARHPRGGNVYITHYHGSPTPAAVKPEKKKEDTPLLSGPITIDPSMPSATSLAPIPGLSPGSGSGKPITINLGPGKDPLVIPPMNPYAVDPISGTAVKPLPSVKTGPDPKDPTKYVSPNAKEGDGAFMKAYATGADIFQNFGESLGFEMGGVPEHTDKVRNFMRGHEGLNSAADSATSAAGKMLETGGTGKTRRAVYDGLSDMYL